MTEADSSVEPVPEASIERRDHEVRCRDGWRLDVKVVTGPQPRAVAICGHAMMVNRRTLDVGGEGLVTELARRGIACVWPDLRGHGHSGPRAHEGGQWTYDDLVDGDVTALVAFAREKFPGLTVFSVGHSLFGHVALAHAVRHAEQSFDGHVLLAANVWLPRTEPSLARLFAKRAYFVGWWAITRLFGRFPTRLVGMGPDDEAIEYVRDSVGWFWRDDWAARDGFSYVSALSKVRGPVLSIAATNDRLFAPAVCIDRFLRPIPSVRCYLAGRERSRIQPLPDGWQRLVLPIDPDHMGLTTRRECRPVWRRAADFITENASPSRRF